MNNNAHKGWIRRKLEPDFEEVVKRHSPLMDDLAFRNFLMNVEPRDYVSSDATVQGGEVVQVIRDRLGVPACLKVVYTVEGPQNTDDRQGYDYIPVQVVDNWDHNGPADFDDEYETKEETDARMLERGFEWDEEECCYANRETGEQIVW